MADYNKNSNEYGISNAAKDVVKQAKRTSKGAKSVKKLGAKLASGNYAAAIMEFLKNPQKIM